MDSLGMIFLGLIALSSLVQAAFLVMVATGARRLAQRVDELQVRLEKDIRPSLDHLTQVTGNIAEVTDILAAQARRLDGVVASTVEKVDQTAARVQDLVLRPLGGLERLVPFFKGVQAALDVYRQLGGFAAAQDRRGTSRRYQGDEHLFI